MGAAREGPSRIRHPSPSSVFRAALFTALQCTEYSRTARSRPTAREAVASAPFESTRPSPDLWPADPARCTIEFCRMLP